MANGTAGGSSNRSRSNGNGSNSSSNRGGNSSSFTVFQVPGAAAVIPSTSASSRSNAAYGNASIASTLSSSASFEDSPPRGFQMGWSGDYGTTSSLDAGTSNSSHRAPANSSALDTYAPPPLDESYYTYSARGGNSGTHRGSITSSHQLASGISVSTISGFTPSDIDALEPAARGGISWMRTGRVIRVKDTGESFRFPLEDDHLPRVSLTPEQYATLKRRAELLADAALHSAHTWMENPTLAPQLKRQSWKAAVEKKHCVVYRQRGSDSKLAQGRQALVRAKLECTLDELAYALNCDNTEDQRTVVAHTYADSFLDSAVLHVSETASFDDPFQFVGVKWFAFQSSVDAVYAVRDLLVLEVCKTFVDATGQRVLARVSQSIDIADYGGSERAFGFVRTTGSWIHLFRSMGPGSGMVDASLTFSMQFPGRSTPTWFANKLVTGLYNVALNLSTAADAKYIVKSRLVTDKAWVPNHERPACSVCFKSFNLLRSRHHCRVCAEIMCTSCTMELTVLTSRLPVSLQPESGTNLITSAEKFCLKCINKCRQDRRNALLAVRESHAALALAATATATLSTDSTGSTSRDAYEVNSYGRHSDAFFDERASFSDVHSEPFPPSAAAATAPTTGSDGGPINFYGWSSNVTSSGGATGASGFHEPLGSSDHHRDHNHSVDSNARLAHLSGLTISSTQTQTQTQFHESQTRPRAHLSNAHERRRGGSDASVGSSFSDSSGGSEPRWDRRDKATASSHSVGGSHNSHRDGMILLEEAIDDNDDDVVPVEAIPTSFVKMEESIAAQQALLRSMMLEGQKMMRQQQSATRATQQSTATYRPPPLSAQNEFIALETHARLALPPSTTSSATSSAVTSLDHLD